MKTAFDTKKTIIINFETNFSFETHNSCAHRICPHSQSVHHKLWLCGYIPDYHTGIDYWVIS